MNRIDKLFAEKKKNILNIYCTAGFPALDSTPGILLALQKYGADIVEIGMPYSDPIADGPVIQQSNMIALQNGMSMTLLFDQLKKNKEEIHIPVILMGYLNPVMQFGVERFCDEARNAGVDGIILPDLPMYEYERDYAKLLKERDLHFIFLVTPETSEERIRKIDSLSKGFIYAVSSSSTTGKDTNINMQEGYFERLEKMKLNNPVLVGFGIKDKSTFAAACAHTNGAIIGSAYIKALQMAGDTDDITKEFLNSILK